MKKITSILLVLSLLLTMMLGLTSGAVAEGEIYEVVMQFPTLGTTPQDIQMVEDAINARIEEEIGVHLTLYPASAFTLNNTTNLMVSSNEKLDLMMSMFEGGVGSYVNKGMLIELDDLLTEYGADIIEAEGDALSGGYFNGKLYAIPTEEKMGRVQSFLARKDLLDKYEIEYDTEHVYTYEELGAIFETVKAGEGDKFYMIAANSNDDGIFGFFDPTDHLGATLASGALMNYGVDTTEIVNYYETENFANSAGVMRDWYQKGYFAPDCNTATDAAMTLVQSGQYLGMFSNSEPDMILDIGRSINDYLGTEVVPLYVNEPSKRTQFYQITLWAIPITCDNPEKTFEWLNLMYKDADIINLLYHGIEGVHYQFVEGSDCIIEYPEGVDGMNVTYSAVLNVWGDKLKDYVRAPKDETYYQTMRDFNDSISADYTSGTLGYCFDSSVVRTQYAAVTDVITQYQVSLGMGIVDPDAVLPEFLSALKAAGIDEIITENQRQLDEWLATK